MNGPDYINDATPITYALQNLTNNVFKNNSAGNCPFFNGYGMGCCFYLQKAGTVNTLAPSACPPFSPSFGGIKIRPYICEYGKWNFDYLTFVIHFWLYFGLIYRNNIRSNKWICKKLTIWQNEFQFNHDSQQHHIVGQKNMRFAMYENFVLRFIRLSNLQSNVSFVSNNLRRFTQCVCTRSEFSSLRYCSGMTRVKTRVKKGMTKNTYCFIL